jgi:transposase
MYVSSNSTPDFWTINYFRGKILKDNIQALLLEVEKMLVKMGYVSLEVQYIDCTKIE